MFPPRHLFLPTAGALLLASWMVAGGSSWRSVLYPANWTPPDEAVPFATAKLIQDFSYAGYRRGEESTPETNGPVFDATSYGADASGTTDSTTAIQAAINAAAAAGGGVVFLPAGSYRVAPQGNNSFTLRIESSGIVLRGAGAGQTFLINTSHQMRSISVIRIAAPSTPTGPSVAITADLDKPTRRIPVANALAFQAGNIVLLQWEFTQGWIDEHSQGTWWSAPDVVPAPARYFREITAVNPAEGWVEVDVPTRYTIRTRDNPQVRTVSGLLTGVGVEGISIGNVQHPGSGFGENDYDVEGTAAFDAHASYLVRMQDTVDGWVTGVHSFQPAGNTTTSHMLSNGILLVRCFRVTVGDCAMRRPQYGGGGGNGYMYRVQSSNECLVRNCVAEFSRHGFVISHAGTSGNVFLQCEDRETQRATGSSPSGYTTGGSGSDHHMHFSHSNLFDQCHAHNSFFTAHHRLFSGTVPHGLTSAHSVYWNTSGSGSRGGAVVRSEQARYGYVIGTSGSRSGATNPTGGKTAPADHLEGIGQGATMVVPSLYLDQLAKRGQGLLVDAGPKGFTGPISAFPLSGSVYTYGSSAVASLWTQISGPATAVFADASSPATTVSFPEFGTYVLELSANDSANSASAQVTIEVGFPRPCASAHFIRGETQDPETLPMGYFTSASDVIGTSGSNGSRDDRNVVLGYALPALPVGTKLESATLAFEITAARDSTGPANLPGLHVYLLDSANPADGGTSFFYHGPLDPSQAAKRIGSTFVPVSGTEENHYAAGGQRRLFTLGGDALALLQGFYNGHLPTRNTVYFRFNLGVDPSINDYRRYRIGTSSDGSSLHLLPTAPAPTYSITYHDNQATDGTVPADQTKIQDIDLTLATNSGGLVRSGHVFLGWNTEADGSGADYAGGATYSANASATLFAKWNAIPSASAGLDQTIMMTGTTPWTPAQIFTAAWYDASDASTMTIQGGNAVAEWRDKSGNDNHAGQANSAVRPSTGNGTLGGRPAVSFRVGDGTSKQFLSAPNHPSLNLDSSGGANVFAVMRYLGYVDQGSSLNAALTKGQLLSAQSAYGIRVSNGNALGYQAGSNCQVNTTNFSNQEIIFAGTGDFSANSAQIFINGQLRNSTTATGSFISDNAAPLHIGRDNSAGRYANVDFGEILVVGGVLTNEECQQIEGYLAHKWGLEGSLPAEHPCKNGAPVNQGGFATATLDGLATDAENDPLSLTWSVVSGPGEVSFSAPSLAASTATFSKAGNYVLRLTVSDGFAITSDEVTVEVTVPTAFESWAGGGEVTFTGDANGDGIADGLAWLLGAAHPTDPAHALLPSARANNDALEVTFAMRSQAARGAAILELQFGTDLRSWATVTIPEESGTRGGVEFFITPNGDRNTVMAKIPASTAPGGRLFIRLSGVEK